MILPSVAARVKQPRQFPAIGIYPSHIGALGAITNTTGEGEVLHIALTLVFQRDDMVNVQRAEDSWSCLSRQYSQRSPARCLTQWRVGKSIKPQPVDEDKDEPWPGAPK